MTKEDEKITNCMYMCSPLANEVRKMRQVSIVPLVGSCVESGQLEGFL